MRLPALPTRTRCAPRRSIRQRAERRCLSRISCGSATRSCSKARNEHVDRPEPPEHGFAHRGDRCRVGNVAGEERDAIGGGRSSQPGGFGQRTVAAPDERFAEIYAREQYGRRQESVALWLVPREAVSEIAGFPDEFELKYRRVDGYSIKARLREAREKAGTLELAPGATSDRGSADE